MMNEDTEINFFEEEEQLPVIGKCLKCGDTDMPITVCCDYCGEFQPISSTNECHFENTNKEDPYCGPLETNYDHEMNDKIKCDECESKTFTVHYNGHYCCGCNYSAEKNADI